jgi:BirA family biotin operon repressor/biotin-[acetyl-CoA-carboxylase] ligase
MPRIGGRLLRLAEVDSTNTVAAGYADDPANDGLAVWAEVQTAGRGSQGRSWQSPPDWGVWLSVLLFPPPDLRRPVYLTILAAVAVCETVYDCARLQTTIKWPNDVLIRGRKVCGILVEQGRAAVVGIGLNVNTPAEAFAAAGLDQAGSLALFTGAPLDREAVVATLLGHLDGYYAALRNGEPGDLEARWRFHSALLGRAVTLQTATQRHSGRLLDLSFDGIVLEGEGGVVHRLVPEEIRSLAAAPL